MENNIKIQQRVVNTHWSITMEIVFGDGNINDLKNILNVLCNEKNIYNMVIILQYVCIGIKEIKSRDIQFLCSFKALSSMQEVSPHPILAHSQQNILRPVS